MSIYKRGDVYWFSFVFRARRIQRSTRQRDRRVARQIEAAWRTALAKGEAGIFEAKPVPSFDVAMKDFLAWSEQEHRAHPRTHTRYAVSSVALRKFFGGVRLDRITVEDVEKFKTKRRAQVSARTERQLRPATVNRELACLKALFNFVNKGRKQGETILQNPVSQVKFLNEDNEQTRVLTFDEQKLYLLAAKQPLRDVAGVMLETGMRPEEVYRIDKANVRLDEGYLFNPYGKTRAAKRKIPLTQAASEILLRRMSSATGSFVFPSRSDPTRPISRVNALHNAAVTRSKIRRCRLYDLRHTWATRVAESGVDLVSLAALLGHSRLQMVMRYAHPTEQHQAEAVKKFEAFVSARRV